MQAKRWQLAESRIPQSGEEVLGFLLTNRGVDGAFLETPLADLEVHCGCCGMSEGAVLVASHLKRGTKIVLVGDYDCDGITSASQMALYLREIGYGNFETVLPDRSEGYGMPLRAVTDHPDASLFIALDCGTHDFQAISAARERGADTVVIDHHEVGETGAAPATVLINPKQSGCPSRFKELCSSGLTLLFLTRLRKALDGTFPSISLGGKYLALAAVGTLADMVPLVEGNRIIARNGLQALNANPFPPLSKIAGYAGLAGKRLNAGHVGFQLAPRINAAGRMASPRIAYDLLMGEDPEGIERAALMLHNLNRARQAREETILKEIAARFTGAFDGRRTVVLADPGWPLGLVGILASRVQQELLYGPSIILATDPANGIARGSARSIPGFDLHRALQKTSHLLLKWGGHKMAGGVTVSIDKLDAFAEAFENIASECPKEAFLPVGLVDMELPLDYVTEELMESLDRLEPHGSGNPRPTFACRGARLNKARSFGKEMEHVSMTVGNRLSAVYWRGSRRLATVSAETEGPLDIVVQLDRDRRTNAPLLNVKDVGRLFHA
ncbi:MAG: DHH family phosphoesterase [Syntrophobacteraceae bacterium]